MPRATKKTKSELAIQNALRDHARANLQEEGALEIDEGADVSVTAENVASGALKGYVQAWVWVDLTDGAEG
jgi:hypothetical protein